MKLHLSKMFMLVLLLLAAVLAQAQERIANEGAIGDKWMLADGTSLAMAQYPPSQAGRGADVCMALGYVIGKDGATSDFSVLKQWNSESGEKEPADDFWRVFAQAGADAVSQWRFKPRPEVANPMPTRTVTTIGFNGRQGTGAAALRSHCQIKDLPERLAQLKARPRGTAGQEQNQKELEAQLRRLKQY